MSNYASVHRTVLLDGNPERVRGLRTGLESFLADRGVVPATRRAIVLAFSEALDNAMEHGMRAGRGEVVVRLRFTPRYITLSLRDEGSDRSPLGVANEATDTDERGRGFMLMNQLMDVVKVRHLPAGGTRVSMMRRLDTVEE